MINSLLLHFDKIKLCFYIILSIFLLLFIITLIQVKHETKEINCITYYTSLGYTANGCDKIVRDYIDSNDN